MNHVGDPRVVEEILKLEDERVKAITSSDGPALKRLFHDDLIYIHSGGTINTKKEYIEKRLDPNGEKFNSFDFSHVKVRVHGDTAIVTGDLILNVTHPARGNLTVSLRFTHIWIREIGPWRSVHWHNSKRTVA